MCIDNGGGRWTVAVGGYGAREINGEKCGATVIEQQYKIY